MTGSGHLKGIFQGNPLSPFIIVVMDVLSCKNGGTILLIFKLINEK